VSKEAERRSRNTQQRKVAWKGHGAESINGEEQKVQGVCRRH
jgi:hypothetical protein